MLDVLVLVMLLSLFGMSALLVLACERIVGAAPAPTLESAPEPEKLSA